MGKRIYPITFLFLDLRLFICQNGNMVKEVKILLHHYFYPHQSNNYRAKSLHHSSIVFYIILLFAFQLFFGQVEHLHRGVLGYATDISVENLLSLINEKRKENNLPPLALSAELSEAATKKATDMFVKNYWAHVSPTGTTPWEFISSSGYRYVYAGENLAKDFNTSSEVVSAWMNSTTHRANILKPEYADIGLAVVNGHLNGGETTLVVEHFGSKMAAKDFIKETDEQITYNYQISGTSAQQKIIPLLNSVAWSKTLSLTVTEFLLIVLFLDSLYIWRNRPVRLIGHSLSHIIFLAALLGAMGATGVGVIL